MRISDWSSDVCSSDLGQGTARERCGCGVDLWLWLAGLSRRADVLGRYRRLEEDRRRDGEARVRRGAAATRESGKGYAVPVVSVTRSAERRVGNEWVGEVRSRWRPYHSKKTKIVFA